MQSGEQKARRPKVSDCSSFTAPNTPSLSISEPEILFSDRNVNILQIRPSHHRLQWWLCEDNDQMYGIHQN